MHIQNYSPFIHRPYTQSQTIPPDTALSKYALALPRQKLRILDGLLTGEADLNHHLYNESQ